MSRLPHTIKCKYHPQSEMLFIEEPVSSPHAFKGVCKGCGGKFVSWVSMSVLEEIVRDTPSVEIKPRPKSKFDDLFE